MKVFCILLFLLFACQTIFAQPGRPCVPCLPYGYEFITQSQIDDFHINYPNCTKIIGTVWIGDAASSTEISNLNGLSMLTSIGILYIVNNSVLVDLSGLNNLDTVQYGLTISENDSLLSLTGLENLKYVGGNLGITDNASLTDLSGLINLTTIGADMPNYYGLYINDNHVLNSLLGLNNLTNLNQNYLFIQNNDTLRSLIGLDHIDPGSIYSLYISGNYNLSVCAFENICEFLDHPGGDTYIAENGKGCKNESQVSEACDTLSVPAPASGANFLIYPNPASATLIIETPVPGLLLIRNATGNILFQQQITEPNTTIDVSGLKSGIYVVKVVREMGVQVGKIVKW